MPVRLYIFGSTHVDPTEKAELKSILRKVNDSDGVVAAEFENDKYTTVALKHFRDLNDRQVRTVVEHEFGKRRVIAPYTFLKMTQKYEGIKEVVSIEPKFEGTVKHISSAIIPRYQRFNEYLKYAKSHINETGTADKLFQLYTEFQRLSAKQCMLREEHMSAIVADIAKNNPGDTLVYANYVHTAAIKKYIRKEHIAYEEREDSYIHELEKARWKMYNIALNSERSSLTKQNKIILARSILEYEVVYADGKDSSIKQEHRVYKAVGKSIKTIKDFVEALSNFDEFKKSVKAASS
jgi:hypothetical protein